MAGRGPQPKDPARRARRNADPVARTVLRFEHAEAPDLPPHLADDYYTVRWWETWVGSAQAEHFSATDWQFLYETAFVVHAFYMGRMDVASELRLRQAKFGATPEDRARLRMVFAEADEADDGKGSSGAEASDARSRFGDLRVIGDPPDEDAG